MNIFQRSANGLNLSPTERAFLKLGQNWLLTALGAGITAGAQYALGNQQINFTALAYLTGGAFGLSILSALNKYWSSQGDTPLALAAQAGEQRVQQVVQNATSTPAQQAQMPKQIPLPTNIQQPPVQQVPFPSNPFTPPINPQALPAVNLATMTADQNVSTRHFGDSQIMPTVQ